MIYNFYWPDQISIFFENFLYFTSLKDFHLKVKFEAISVYFYGNQVNTNTTCHIHFFQVTSVLMVSLGPTKHRLLLNYF